VRGELNHHTKVTRNLEILVVLRADLHVSVKLARRICRL
jgi:hypothetical protein